VASEVDFTKQDGVTMIETLIALPLLILLLAVVLALAMFFAETIWVDQTAYNASLLGAELDSGLSVGERSVRISRLAECLSSVHQNEGHKVFLSFDPATDIVVAPFNPANLIPADPESRLNKVVVGGTVRNLMDVRLPFRMDVQLPLQLQQSVVAVPLVGAKEKSQSPFFAGSTSSGSYAHRDCCGRPVTAPPSSCVTNGAYDIPFGCTADDPGFYATP
jgi:hypothetical protein